MIRKGFSVNYLPLKTYTSMDVGTGTEPVQEYDATANMFYPDRSVSPLVLTPVVGYHDPNDGTEVANAAKQLTNGHWYRLDNTTSGALDSTTEIKSGTTYVIDTLAGSATYGRITISENVQPGNPVTYVFKATLTHPGGEKKIVECRWQPRTKAVTRIPVLTIDNATEVMYDPLGNADIITFNPVLKPAGVNATYTWDSMHNGTWRPLLADQLDWAIEKVGNGVKVRQSVMPDRIDLRCNVSVPFSAMGKTGNITQSVCISIVRRIPKYKASLYGVMNITKDVKSISPTAVIEVGRKRITDLKGELAIIWKNSAGTEVGRGLHPVIPVSALNGVLDIGFDDVDMGGWKLLVDSDGAVITDNGALILVK